MKKIGLYFFIALLFSVTAISMAWTQSLADIAEKEKLRREEIEEAPVPITNDDVSSFTGGSVSTGTVPPSNEPDSESIAETEESAEEGENPNPDEPTDFKGRTESYWRETMTEARQKVKNLEQESQVLTLRMNDLENKFYNIDDGFDRDTVQKDIQKTYYEIDLNKENLEKAKKELEDLEKEARSSGALPGWIE